MSYGGLFEKQGDILYYPEVPLFIVGTSQMSIRAQWKPLSVYQMCSSRFTFCANVLLCIVNVRSSSCPQLEDELHPSDDK